MTACPVTPGTVYYGVLPSPPPFKSTDPNAMPGPEQIKMCAKLISSMDDCPPGQKGSLDRMKYTVSECVEQQIDSKDESSPPATIAPPQLNEISNQGKLVTIAIY